MADLIPFNDKLRKLLWERNITITDFCLDLGIDRTSFFYKNHKKHRLVYYKMISIYLNMTVEELVKGTDAEDVWII